MRFDGLGAPGIVAGNWDATGDQAWLSSGPPLVRAADGTLLAAGLALAPGANTWTLREIPARTRASGPTLIGVAKHEFFTSHDGGGLGELIATRSIEVDGEAIPAAQLRTVAFDEQGYAYTARGMPNVQIWRSNKPVDRAVSSRACASP